MNQLRTLFTSLHENESGQDLIEYALIACLIALAAVGTMGTLASYINNAFNKVGSTLNSAIS